MFKKFKNKTKQNKRPLELTNLDAWGSERLKINQRTSTG
jgi:hypothetical protein